MRRALLIVAALSIVGCSRVPYLDRLRPGQEGEVVAPADVREGQDPDRRRVAGRCLDPGETPIGARLVPVGSMARVVADPPSLPETDRGRPIEVLILTGTQAGYHVRIRRDQFAPH